MGHVCGGCGCETAGEEVGGGGIKGGGKRLLDVTAGMLNGDGTVRAAMRVSTARRI